MKIEIIKQIDCDFVSSVGDDGGIKVFRLKKDYITNSLELGEIHEVDNFDEQDVTTGFQFGNGDVAYIPNDCWKVI